MSARGWFRTVAGMVASAAVLHAAWVYSDGTARVRVGPWMREDGTMMREAAQRALTVPAALAIAGVLAGLLLLVWRPRWGFGITLAAMIAYGAAGGPSLALVVPGIFASVGLVRRVPLSRAWPWFLGLPLALWSGWWDAPALGLTDWQLGWALASATTWMLAPTALVALGMARRRTVRAEQEEAVRRAAYEERLRVVRDIHDIVGHSLSMISLQSAVALRVLDADPAQARTSLEAIRSSSKESLAELRAALGVFREEDSMPPAGQPDPSVAREASGAPLAPTPTLASLGALVDEVRAGGVDVALAPVPAAAGISAAAKAAAYRIVQESLTNAVRHAPGRRVRVALTRHPDALGVRIADDGRPAGDVVEGGGLTGMRQRAEALGGSLSAGPTAEGFVVEGWLPFQPGGGAS